MYPNRLRGTGRFPPGMSQSEGKIEDIHVGENRPVEAAALLPGRPTVGAGRTLRPDQQRSWVVGVLERSAAQSLEPCERGICGDADIVDRPFVALDHQ